MCLFNFSYITFYRSNFKSLDTQKKSCADGFMGCAKCREQKIQFENVVIEGVVKPDASKKAKCSDIWRSTKKILYYLVNLMYDATKLF